METDKVKVDENTEEELKIDPQNKNIDGVIDSNENLKGLSGWLILIGIGIVFSPIRLIFLLIKYMDQFFMMAHGNQ